MDARSSGPVTRFGAERQLIALVESVACPNTVLASNTSSLGTGELGREFAPGGKFLRLQNSSGRRAVGPTGAASARRIGKRGGQSLETRNWPAKRPRGTHETRRRSRRSVTRVRSADRLWSSSLAVEQRLQVCRDRAAKIRPLTMPYGANPAGRHSRPFQRSMVHD